MTSLAICPRSPVVLPYFSPLRLPLYRRREFSASWGMPLSSAHVADAVPYAAAVQFECAGVVSLWVLVRRLLSLGSLPPSVVIFVRAVQSRCLLWSLDLAASSTVSSQQLSTSSVRSAVSFPFLIQTVAVVSYCSLGAFVNVLVAWWQVFTRYLYCDVRQLTVSVT